MQCIVQLIVMVQSDNLSTTTTIHTTNTKSELMVVLSV